MELIELRRRRANLITEARKILNDAEARPEGQRDLTQEEQNRFDTMMAEADRQQGAIDREERMQREEAALQESAGRAAPPADARSATQAAAAGELRELRRYRAANGQERTLMATDARRSSDEYHQSFRTWMQTGELRANQADLDTAGGFTVASQQMAAGIIEAIDNEVIIRGLATVLPLARADSLGVLTRTADVDDADWTSELATGNADDALRFGKRELRPHPLAKRILISNKLLRASVMDMEAYVRGRLAYKFGVSLEKGAMTGTGAQQPLGVFTASNDGISTGRDVSTGNTTTEITFDGLINAKFSIKTAYWPRLRYVTHRDGVKQLAKLKDGDGNYIWQMGNVLVNQPERLLGVPVLMSEYAPNTFTTGLYVGLFGDFSQYWFADALDLQFQRLVELYALTNQTALIGRLESDGMPMLEEAFARVKLA